MISERWWLMGAFVVTLAGASISTWTTAGPRLEGTASAATPRHRVPAQRDETVDPLRVSAPDPPPAAPVTPPPPRARSTRARSGVSIEVRDLPGPPADPPLLWDDMFPGPPRPANGGASPAMAPCFDRLQGIGGLSPCPAVTPR
jgi:hypothetical protein